MRRTEITRPFWTAHTPERFIGRASVSVRQPSRICSKPGTDEGIHPPTVRRQSPRSEQNRRSVSGSLGETRQPRPTGPRLSSNCHLSGYSGPRFSPKMVQVFSPKLVHAFSPKVVHSFSAKLGHRRNGATPPAGAYCPLAIQCEGGQRCPETGGRPWTFERCCAA